MRIHLDDPVRGEFGDHAIGAVRLLGNDLAVVARSGFESLSNEPFDETAVQSAVDHWQHVFQKMGARPKYKSSLQSLLEVSLAGKLPATARPLVDYYNQLSLHHAIPAGGYDVRGWDGDLWLVRSTRDLERLSFIPLGEPNSQPQHTRSGEVAYRDSSKIVCRYWNWRDCHESRLQDDSTDIVLVFDLVQGLDGESDGFSRILAHIESHFGPMVIAAGCSDDRSSEIDLHG